MSTKITPLRERLLFSLAVRAMCGLVRIGPERERGPCGSRAGQDIESPATELATTMSATARDGSRAPPVPMLQTPAKRSAAACAARTAAMARSVPTPLAMAIMSRPCHFPARAQWTGRLKGRGLSHRATHGSASRWSEAMKRRGWYSRVTSASGAIRQPRTRSARRRWQ